MNASLVKKVTATNSALSSTILRVIIGLIMIPHGAQKLFGSFGGYGLEGTGQFMASIGLEPGYLMALLAGSAEFFGGLLLVIGLLVRPAAAVLAFTMLMAILTVHLGGGFFASNGGFEYPLALLAATVSLVFSGAGAYSVDKMIASK